MIPPLPRPSSSATPPVRHSRVCASRSSSAAKRWKPWCTEDSNMSLLDDFGAAQLRVKQLREQPSIDELLDLYALYKQGTLADVQTKRPDMLDIRGRAKWDAWTRRKGMTKDDAMRAYVDLVAKLVAQQG